MKFGFSFSRRGPAADHALATPPSHSTTHDAEASPLRPAPAEAGMEREKAKEQTHIERSQSGATAEAPTRRRPRARKTDVEKGGACI
jgi:hypothetical protein